jgi:microcin C transport system permease protein
VDHEDLVERAVIGYVARRLLLMIPTLLGILLVSFLIIQFVPGGPVDQLVQELTGRGRGGEVAAAAPGYRGAQGVAPEQLERIKALYGFDRPAPERFWEMLKRYARFDLGTSYFYQKSVWGLIKEKLPVSISLGVWSFLLVYLISIPLGIAKALRNGSRFDLWTSTAILVGYAIPGFVLGVALLVLFGGGSFLALFPLRGLTSDDFASLSRIGKVLDYFWHLALPLACLTVGSFAVTTMLTKNVFLEEIGRQYVLTARAKGLSERRVFYRHVFRNALIPLVTAFPAAFVGAFFTGSLLIETLFSLDGLGLLSYDAVIKRDYPVVMGSLYLFSLIGLVTKLITDLAYTWVDPRVSFAA